MFRGLRESLGKNGIILYLLSSFFIGAQHCLIVQQQNLAHRSNPRSSHFANLRLGSENWIEYDVSLLNF